MKNSARYKKAAPIIGAAFLIGGENDYSGLFLGFSSSLSSELMKSRKSDNVSSLVAGSGEGVESSSRSALPGERNNGVSCSSVSKGTLD